MKKKIKKLSPDLVQSFNIPDDFLDIEIKTKLDLDTIKHKIIVVKKKDGSTGNTELF